MDIFANYNLLLLHIVFFLIHDLHFLIFDLQLEVSKGAKWYINFFELFVCIQAWGACGLANGG
jgi:hypothetical protein